MTLESLHPSLAMPEIFVAVMAMLILVIAIGYIDFSSRIGRGVMTAALPMLTTLIGGHHLFIYALGRSRRERIAFIVNSEFDASEAKVFAAFGRLWSGWAGLPTSSLCLWSPLVAFGLAVWLGWAGMPSYQQPLPLVAAGRFTSPSVWLLRVSSRCWCWASSRRGSGQFPLLPAWSSASSSRRATFLEPFTAACRGGVSESAPRESALSACCSTSRWPSCSRHSAKHRATRFENWLNRSASRRASDPP